MGAKQAERAARLSQQSSGKKTHTKKKNTQLARRLSCDTVILTIHWQLMCHVAPPAKNQRRCNECSKQSRGGGGGAGFEGEFKKKASVTGQQIGGGPVPAEFLIIV